jgi:hypothetical protein
MSPEAQEKAERKIERSSPRSRLKVLALGVLVYNRSQRAASKDYVHFSGTGFAAEALFQFSQDLALGDLFDLESCSGSSRRGIT